MISKAYSPISASIVLSNLLAAASIFARLVFGVHILFQPIAACGYLLLHPFGGG
jgi:hypothetical protein